MARIRTAAASAALVLTLAACGSEASTTEAVTATPEAESSDSQSSAPVGLEIEGSFATVAGGQLDVGALEGQDTVLWFWAPW